MRIEKLFLGAGLLAWSCCALAADEASAPAAAQPSVPATQAGTNVTDQTRPALTTGYAQRGEELARIEDVVWFEAAGERRWMGVQAASGALRGNVLLLAEPGAGANGPAYTAALRQRLPNYGWRTHYTNLTLDDGQIATLVGAAIASIPQGRPIVVAEGETCERLVNLATAQAVFALGAGLVCVNVPVSGSQRAIIARLQAFASLPLPTLVLQEQPNYWPSYLALAQDVEVHILPPGAPLSVSVGQADGMSFETSQVLRKIRGWLRRRFATT